MERKQRARRTELEARKLAALFARALNISSLSEDRGGEGAKSNTTTPSGRPELATCFVKLLLRKLRLHHLKLVMFEKSSENRAFEFVRLRVSSSFLTLSFFFVTTC